MTGKQMDEQNKYKAVMTGVEHPAAGAGTSIDSGTNRPRSWPGA